MNHPTPPPLILSSEREIHQLLSVLTRLRLTKVEVLETEASGELVQLKVETQTGESVPQLVPDLLGPRRHPLLPDWRCLHPTVLPGGRGQTPDILFTTIRLPTGLQPPSQLLRQGGEQPLNVPLDAVLYDGGEEPGEVLGGPQLAGGVHWLTDRGEVTQELLYFPL